MIANLLWCLIFCQLPTYGMLNRIIDISNNLWFVCFLCIYQNNILLPSILRYHISSTNISPCPFSFKEISHYITLVQIILFIQPHTHRLKRIISFSNHNQQTKKTRMQKQRKSKYQIAKTEQISQKLNK